MEGFDQERLERNALFDSIRLMPRIDKVQLWLRATDPEMANRLFKRLKASEKVLKYGKIKGSGRYRSFRISGKEFRVFYVKINKKASYVKSVQFENPSKAFISSITKIFREQGIEYHVTSAEFAFDFYSSDPEALLKEIDRTLVKLHARARWDWKSTRYFNDPRRSACALRVYEKIKDFEKFVRLELTLDRSKLKTLGLHTFTDLAALRPDRLLPLFRFVEMDWDRYMKACFAAHLKKYVGHERFIQPFQWQIRDEINIARRQIQPVKGIQAALLYLSAFYCPDDCPIKERCKVNEGKPPNRCKFRKKRFAWAVQAGLYQKPADLQIWVEEILRDIPIFQNFGG